MGKELYVEIWKDYLHEILSAIKNNGDIIDLAPSRFRSAGNRIDYSFRLDINNGVVPIKSGSAVARDLKMVLDENSEFKDIAKGKNIVIRLNTKFELIVSL